MKLSKPLLVTLGIFVSLLLFIGCSSISTYNNLVSQEETVKEAKSKVDATLQRRYDLIPNVVSSVKGYMAHEEQVFADIADARSKIGSSNTTTSEQGQTELDSAISRLLVLTENYPELKSDTQVSTLIAELEGTENRIYVARTDYNTVATKYNTALRRFPGSIFANLYGFESVELYKANEKASTAPSVHLSSDE